MKLTDNYNDEDFELPTLPKINVKHVMIRVLVLFIVNDWVWNSTVK